MTLYIDDTNEGPKCPICFQELDHAPGCPRGAEEDAEEEE